MSKIVHVVEATATGTLSMLCIAANIMARRNHQVHVVFSRRQETPDNISDLFDSSISLHELNMSGYTCFRSLPALRRLLVDLDPEIVHLHSSFAGFMGRFCAMGMLPDAKFFYSPHCISVMRQDISFGRYLFAALERIADLKACTYIACSMSEQHAIKRWIGRDSLLLENAFNFSPAHDSPLKRREVFVGEELHVVTVGGVRPQKDPSLFASICELSSRLGIPAKFTWVGDGDAGLVRRLRAAGVSVSGWRSRDEVAKLLEQSHIYLSTSRWEGMPVSVIEAMHSGNIVVATRCTGNVDVIDHGETGLLFDTAKDACALINSIAMRLIDASSLIAAARYQTTTRFSTLEYAEKLNEYYFSKDQEAI